MRLTIPHAIESTRQSDYVADDSSELYTLIPTHHLDIGASRSGSKVHSVSVSDDELLELTLDDGSIWYLGADERDELLQRQAGSSRSSSDGSLVLDDAIFNQETSRGFVSNAIKRIRVLLHKGADNLGDMAEELAREQFGDSPVDTLRSKIVDPIAYTIARKLEKKLATGGISQLCQVVHDAGTVTLSPLSSDKLATLFDADRNKPTLLLLHGTLSSTAGSFGDLWEKRNRDFQQLLSRYGDRIIALEHCTLTESPVSNALLVARNLPKHAHLHLLSHSRGGLVGELLCRGTRLEENAFSLDELSMFEAQHDKSLSVAGLNAKSTEALRQHFEAESAMLKELDNTLNDCSLVIDRFVRVGCPARGTTLASGKLHRWSNRAFNAVGLLGGQKVNPVYRAFEQFTLGILKSNTKPDVLPGLQAQMPGSALIHVLNNTPASVPADLSIVSGDLDITKRLNWKRIPVWVSDKFFGGANDLVVNTASMDGGARRDGGIRELRVIGDHVNHFSYFSNADSARQLITRLVDESAPRFESIKRPDEVHIPRSRKPAHSFDRPVLVLVPGVLGSELKIDGKTIWLNLPALVMGRITRLLLQDNAPPVTASDVLDRAYGDFITHFAKSHDVHIAAYDWRQSLTHCAQSLAHRLTDILNEQDEHSRVQPIRLVAHSMGGLVVRCLIADHPELWDRIRSRSGSRFIMAGTPTNGSYSTNLIFAGRQKLIKLLALADIRNNKRDIMDVVATFPGLAALLPGFGKHEWLQESTWLKVASSPDGDEWSLLDKQALACARRERQKILETPLDASMVSYVAGQSEKTAIDAQFEPQHGDRLCFHYTAEGDGQVGWDEGIPQGLPGVWYQPSVHGSLLADQRHFDAWNELLQTGQTRKLSKQRPVSGKRSDDAPETWLEPDVDDIDFLPDSRTLAELAMGMEPSFGKIQVPETRDVLRVRIAHADLSFSSYPVAVGHYDGDSILHAEKKLDKELDHRLSERQSTGQYPGPIGSSEVIFKRSESGVPEGALVIGLGKLGELSNSKLERTLQSAMVKYIFECNDWWTSRHASTELPVLGLSVLLIGSGLGSTGVHDSVGALLKAATRTNDVFRQKQIDGFQLLGEIEIVELYQDLALQAAQSVSGWSRHLKAIEFDNRIKSGHGGKRRSYFTASSDWWHTIGVKVSESDNEYIYDDFTRYARNELSREPVNRVFVDHFIEQIMHSTHYDNNEHASANEALFQLLFPQALKESTPDSDKLLLSLDDETARIPWEMLVDGWSADRKPLAISKLIVRRLATGSDMLRPEPSRRNAALVVGDPPSGKDGYPVLRGAREEAREVERQLSINERFEVTSCISDDNTDGQDNAMAMEVVRHLFAQEFRIMHLAGHGSYYRSTGSVTVDPDDEGMVLGEGLRLTPAMVRKLPRAPAVVFLNCCHLGHVERRDNDPRVRFNHIAANLATQFIRSGAQVVIAAGWEVDDRAARQFAEVFYDRLLSNKPLSHCIHEARLVTYNQFPNVNTFGAYQCWGDPEFRLDPRREAGTGVSSVEHFMSSHECILEADNIRNAAFTARENERVHLLSEADELLNHIVKQFGDPWKTPATRQLEWTIDRTRVLGQLGRAYGELGNLEAAVALLRIANTLNPSALSASDLEQLGNFEVRHAIHPAGDIQASDLFEIPHSGNAWEVLKSGQRRLSQLLHLYSENGTGTSLREIHCLMGSGAKREALYVAANRKAVSRICTCLKHMQHHYGMGWTGETEDISEDQDIDTYIRQAAINQQAPDQYAFVNFALAFLMRRWCQSAPVDPLPEAFVELVSLFTRSMQQTSRRHDSFWSAIMEADVMMLQLLDVELRERVHLYDVDVDLPEAIKHIYIAADKRFGSCRQWSSAFDHLSFIEAMIVNKHLYAESGNAKAKPVPDCGKLRHSSLRGHALTDEEALILSVAEIKQCVDKLRSNP